MNLMLYTNLHFIQPTEYITTYPIKLTILEYKVNEISNKPFYIKEYNEKYNLKEKRLLIYKFSKVTFLDILYLILILCKK